jgi:hypothetical protein
LTNVEAEEAFLSKLPANKKYAPESVPNKPTRAKKIATSAMFVRKEHTKKMRLKTHIQTRTQPATINR